MICKLLVEKNGIRAIECITEIHRDTISDVIKALARHAREVTDFLINTDFHTPFNRHNQTLNFTPLPHLFFQ